MKYLTLLTFIGIATLFSCTRENVATENQKLTEFTLSDTSLKFEIKARLSEDGTSLLISASDEVKAKEYFKQLFDKQQFTAVIELDAMLGAKQVGGSTIEMITLVAKGVQDDGSRMPIAHEFLISNDSDISNKALYGSSGKTHSCTGRGCNCCEFIYDVLVTSTYLRSYIVGCKCSDQNNETGCTGQGSCDHSVTANG